MSFSPRGKFDSHLAGEWKKGVESEITTLRLLFCYINLLQSTLQVTPVTVWPPSLKFSQHFTASSRAQASPCRQIDRLGDRSYRAVHQQHTDNAWVVTA